MPLYANYDVHMGGRFQRRTVIGDLIPLRILGGVLVTMRLWAAVTQGKSGGRSYLELIELVDEWLRRWEGFGDKWSQRGR